ncbi:MAG: MoaD/ThiS family protein, partial [Chitinophagia bacterium]|nr:MoaD/ThiS family protein [Chitinophagia bacterium]
AAPPAGTVGAFRQQLLTEYAGLLQLRTFAIAVNGEYAADEDLIKPGDEVAIIPPVSGG